MRGYLVRPATATAEAARRARRAREPRPQPAHRGHRAAPGARQLRRLRARRAAAARRLSGRRGQGARGVRQARSGQDARGLRRRRRLPEGAARVHRARSASWASATAAASPTCWRPGCRTSRRRCPSTATSRRPTRSPKIKAPLLIHYAENDERDQRGLAGVRGRAEGEQRARTRCTVPGHAARLQQRHDARGTTRPRRSWRGSARSSSSTRTFGSRAKCPGAPS